MEPTISTALAALIGSSPSLVIAVWTILRQDARIDKLLESQKWLIEQLMALHPPQEEAGPDAPGAPPLAL